MAGKPSRHRRGRAPRRTSSSVAYSAPEYVELVLGEPAHGGACVAREPSGRVVFVRHGLPGERVKARITSSRHTLAWADVEEVYEPSPDRVDSVWSDAGSGGVSGGELGHVAPVAQRRWKTTVLSTQLRRVGGEALAARVEDIGGVSVAPAFGDEDERDSLLGRRTRIELVITDAGTAGMHRYRDREVVGLSCMPLAVPSIQDLDLFGSDSPWCNVWQPGDRVRVVAPTGGEAVLVTQDSIYCADGPRIEQYPLTWTVDLGDKAYNYKVNPRGFWQAHVRGADVLATAVREAAGDIEGAQVMDLYSGAGLFTRLLGHGVRESGQVVSLEREETAVADASKNLDGMEWVETFIGDVDEDAIIDLNASLKGVVDLVVLDPPRSGVAKKVCRTLGDIEAKRVILVSCDPAAGARDLRALTENGFVLDEIRAWDLFPHTHHFETLAVLHRP